MGVVSTALMAIFQANQDAPVAPLIAEFRCEIVRAGCLFLTPLSSNTLGFAFSPSTTTPEVERASALQPQRPDLTTPTTVEDFYVIVLSFFLIHRDTNIAVGLVFIFTKPFKDRTKFKRQNDYFVS